MEIRTQRLILRPWRETDAESLYEYASDPEVGLIAGWPPHKSVADSLAVIRNVLSAEETYAVCRKEDGRAIGSVGLILNGRTDMTDRDDECELGFWIGREFWGQGLIPEAAGALLDHAFGGLHMRTVWCGYYDGNARSKRCQEKLGFVYHHTCKDVPVLRLGETRVGHTNFMTRERWQALREER